MTQNFVKILLGLSTVVNLLPVISNAGSSSTGLVSQTTRSNIGISTYGSDAFDNQVLKAIRSIESQIQVKASTDIGPRLSPQEIDELNQVATDLKNHCFEGQSSQSRVEWITQESTRISTFVCFQRGNLDQAKSITIRQSLNAFSEGQDLLAATSSDLHIAVDECTKRPFLYLSQTVGIGASTFIASIAAKKIMNDGGDKQWHAGASALMVSAFGSVLFNRFGFSAAESATYGAIASCSIGLLKEVTDPMMNRVGEKADMKANLIGCAIGWAATYFINRRIESNEPANTTRKRLNWSQVNLRSLRTDSSCSAQ